MRHHDHRINLSKLLHRRQTTTWVRPHPGRLSEKQAKALHELSDQPEKIVRATLVGCFYCCETFPPTRIRAWTGGRVTSALCPFCGIDSVIPVTPATAKTTLDAMSDYWFNTNNGVLASTLVINGEPWRPSQERVQER